MNTSRGTLREIHCADLHFGAPGINPETQYNILMDQMLCPLINNNFVCDIFSINGDIFHRKFPSNSDVVKYALLFVYQCVCYCRNVGATLVILEGTKSHDDGQTSLFLPFTEDPTVDVRVVQSTQFIYVKGAKILCITEEYGKGREYYEHFLYKSGVYDAVFMHGTIKGSIYGANKANLDAKREPIFDIHSFDLCRGPIIAGHVHIAGCYEKHMYYCSSPIRFQFGEEEDKGFILLYHNLDTGHYYLHFNTVESFRYDTIEISALTNALYSDPQQVVNYVDILKASGIDHIRLICSDMPKEALDTLKAYYKQDSCVSIRNNDAQENKPEINTSQDIMQKYAGMDFLMDPKLSDMEKFVQYINYNKGTEFITVDTLKAVLSGKEF